MPIRKTTKRADLMKLNKIQLIKEIERYRGMFTASLKQLDDAQYVQIELDQYKGYLTQTRERLTKVRKERDLAIELLHLRIEP